MSVFSSDDASFFCDVGDDLMTLGLGLGLGVGLGVGLILIKEGGGGRGACSEWSVLKETYWGIGERIV